MKNVLSKIVVALIFLVGIGLLAYPSFSNWWNERTQSVAIATYQDAVSQTDDADNEALLAAAETYNQTVLAEQQAGTMTINALTDEQRAEYTSYLDVTGTGIMGYIKIPKIDVELPIYHGTDEAILEIAVGHIEGTSLPVGGKGTHTVLSGHRGLPSAKLFTDIDSLGEGDVFIIQVLNRKITYEVDQILTVLPEELDSLVVDPDQDYATLVTCTPYGVNSHRLLVRGHRIENLLDEDIETIQIEIPERELSTQERLQQYLPYAIILAAGFFGLALILPGRRKDPQERDSDRRDRRDRRGYRSSEDADYDEFEDDDDWLDDDDEDYYD